VTATLRVGSVMPLTRSATGLIFAANLPRSRWSERVKRELADNRRQGVDPQTLADFLPQLEAIRTAGCAATSGFIPGISGMAAPAVSGDGEMALAVVALGHSASFDPQVREIRTALLIHARRISAALGGPVGG
jgi:DNA-binding IclR family transcriptional regulator